MNEEEKSAEIRKAYGRKYYHNNRERCLANMKKYRDSHREEENARHAAWVKKNREHVSEYEKKRRSTLKYAKHQVEKWTARVKELEEAGVCE